jgi:hypothetical protein
MEEKKCKKCGKVQSIDNFRRNGKYWNSNCKPCQVELTTAHNKKNYKKYYNKYTKKAVKKAWQRGQDFFDRYKSFCGCQKCGDKRYYVLDFHHIDPNTKQRPITYYKHASMEVMKQEIRNCKVLCSNCHREEHWLEKQNIR